MSEERAYVVKAETRYQGMVPGHGEVVVKTDKGKRYTTSSEKEQTLLEQTFGLKASAPTKEDS
jgi:hypothetical protein